MLEFHTPATLAPGQLLGHKFPHVLLLPTVTAQRSFFPCVLVRTLTVSTPVLMWLKYFSGEGATGDRTAESAVLKPLRMVSQMQLVGKEKQFYPEKGRFMAVKSHEWCSPVSQRFEGKVVLRQTLEHDCDDRWMETDDGDGV